MRAWQEIAWLLTKSILVKNNVIIKCVQIEHIASGSSLYKQLFIALASLEMLLL